MHHFVFHSRLRHAWFRRVLETAEHLHLRPESIAVEFQRLFAATAEKQIWLHRSIRIRISHTRSLGFVWLNVNVALEQSLSLRFERSHVDGKAILHVGLEQSLVGFVYFLNWNDFDVGRDVMLAAKIEHLLGLGDAADCRT